MFAHSAEGTSAALTALRAGLDGGERAGASPSDPAGADERPGDRPGAVAGADERRGDRPGAVAGFDERRGDRPGAAVGSELEVWAKLSPNVTDLPAIAGVALSAGATGLTLVNTLMGLAIDPSTGAPRLGNGGGGLSGPALHPVAVRAVHECRSAHPAAVIIGVGGITTGEDAAEMLAAGADAIQVGTATFADPRAPARVLNDLRRWCQVNHIARLDELRGRAHA